MKKKRTRERASERERDRGSEYMRERWLSFYYLRPGRWRPRPLLHLDPGLRVKVGQTGGQTFGHGLQVTHILSSGLTRGGGAGGVCKRDRRLVQHWPLLMALSVGFRSTMDNIVSFRERLHVRLLCRSQRGSSHFIFYGCHLQKRMP